MTTKKTVKKETKKAPKRSLYTLIRTCFHVVLAAYIVVCIVVKVYNVSLNRQQLEIEQQITTYQAEASTITAQISELQDYNRVVEYVDGSIMTNTTTRTIGDG